MSEQQTTAVGFSDRINGAVKLANDLAAMEVKTAQDFSVAGLAVAEIRKLEKDLEEDYKAHPIIVQARQLQAIKGDLAAKLESARKTAKSRMMAWEDQQERQRRAEEERLAQEARAKAEAEAKAKAEAARLEAEKALAEAKAAEAAGQKDLAEIHLEAAVSSAVEAQQIAEDAAKIVTPTIVIEDNTPRVKGHVRRMVPKFRITDASKLPREYLMPDEKKIGQVIRALKAEHRIPGISYYEEAA